MRNKYCSKLHIYKPEHTEINSVVHICKCLRKTYWSLNRTTLVNNYVKLVTMFINLTCNIELKIYISWNKTLLHYSIRVIHQSVANKTDLSCLLVNR